MRRILYIVSILIGSLATIGFCVGWLGPISGEGWGRGLLNIIVMLGSGITGLAMVVVSGITRITGEDRSQASALYIVSMGVNIIPIVGVALMFMGLIRLR